MNNYETVFIVTPVLSEGQVQEVADKFQGNVYWQMNGQEDVIYIHNGILLSH